MLQTVAAPITVVVLEAVVYKVVKAIIKDKEFFLTYAKRLLKTAVDAVKTMLRLVFSIVVKLLKDISSK